jgi:hypothetical protein
VCPSSSISPPRQLCRTHHPPPHARRQCPRREARSLGRAGETAARDGVRRQRRGPSTSAAARSFTIVHLAIRGSRVVGRDGGRKRRGPRPSPRRRDRRDDSAGEVRETGGGPMKRRSWISPATCGMQRHTGSDRERHSGLARTGTLVMTGVGGQAFVAAAHCQQTRQPCVFSGRKSVSPEKRIFADASSVSRGALGRETHCPWAAAAGWAPRRRPRRSCRWQTNGARSSRAQQAESGEGGGGAHSAARRPPRPGAGGGGG